MKFDKIWCPAVEKELHIIIQLTLIFIQIIHSVLFNYIKVSMAGNLQKTHARSQRSERGEAALVPARCGLCPSDMAQ